MSVCKHISKDGLCLLHSEPLYKEPCHEGPCTDYEPLTNADRIRAMTDEELAKWFCDKVSCDCGCLAICKDCGWDDKSCTQAWLDWLKQEADND